MHKKQAIAATERSPRAHRKYQEETYYETIRGTYQILQAVRVGKFTSAWIDSLLDDLNTVLPALDSLPEGTFHGFIEVIHHLAEARNELRLARFLFDVDEIDPVYRLIIRNRAVLRSQGILHRALQVWPSLSPPGLIR